MNEVVSILSDFRRSGDWFYAFRRLSPVLWKKRVLKVKDTRNEELLKRFQTECKARLLLGSHRKISPQEYRRRYEKIISTVQ